MPTEYVRATSVESAIKALDTASGQGVVLAGGLVIGSILNQKLADPGVIVDISRIESLRNIALSDDGELLIGALVTHEEMLHSSIVREAAPLLSQIASDIACWRLRNRGTIGGSLCMIGQQGDPATGLIVLGSRIALRGPEGLRLLALEGFYRDGFSVDLRQGEILEQVLVPKTSQRSGYGFTKIGPRDAMDFTLIAASSGITLADDGAMGSARIALSGVAPTVIRPRQAEQMLAGKTVEQVDWQEVTDALQGEISPQGDPVYSERHKRRLAGVTLRRATESAWARALVSGSRSGGQ